MAQWKLAAYLNAIPGLAADKQFARIEAAAFPHLEKRGREQVLRALQKRQAAIDRNANRAPRRDSLPKDFAAIGIPVTYVKKEPAA